MSAVVRVVAGVIYQTTKVLLVRRGPQMSGAGHWEFPGGKVEPGESEPQALQRELLEELNVQVTVETFLGENVHHYPNKSIHLRFYWVSAGPGLRLSEHDALLWVTPDEIQLETLSEGDRPIVATIANDPRMKKP